MAKVIRYFQFEKSIILNPSPFCDLTIEEIAKKDVPEGCVWEIVNLEDLPAPPEPTPEELRAQMPPISKRQLRLTLVRNGISLAHVEASIAAMPDGLEKQEVEIEWQDASQFTRLHPALLLVANALSLPPAQVDSMWVYALTI